MIKTILKTIRISFSLIIMAIGLSLFQAEPASLIVFGAPLLMLGTSAYVV